MGYDKDHFVSSPDEDLVCPICHDIVEESVNFGVCQRTHIFCRDCADVWSTKSRFTSGSTCPSCRATVRQTYPDWSTRNAVESLKVTCLNVYYNKDQNGFIDDVEICNWTGMCGDLRKHQDECLLQSVVCNNNGCQYKCTRINMDAHLRVCKRHIISSLMDDGDSDGNEQEIVLHGCGMRIVNGIYRTYHHVADKRGSGYFRVTHHRNQVKKVVLWHCNDGRWCIYMVDNGVPYLENIVSDILYTTVDVHDSLPTHEVNWIIGEQPALDPPPRVTMIKQEPD